MQQVQGNLYFKRDPVKRTPFNKRILGSVSKLASIVYLYNKPIERW